MNNKRPIIYVLIGLFLLGTAFVAELVLMPISQSDQEFFVSLRPGETKDRIYAQLEEKTGTHRLWGLQLLHKLSERTLPGRYAVSPSTNAFTLWRAIRNGRQIPLRLTLPYVWDMRQMAGRLGECLSTDSLQWATCFSDSMFCAKYGVTPATLPCLFMPETYEVYYTVSPETLMDKLRDHYDRFWASRAAQAEKMGLTPEEICTLASIVDKETANNEEKPQVAGMYLNRLRKGMKLQADPTVKFGIGNYALRRILHEHLLSNNPYNTYRHEGLPPGPIGMPTVAGVDAVLENRKHSYLYMCAKPDFSGTHNFASTYEEHLRYAAQYADALNKRGIK